MLVSFVPNGIFRNNISINIKMNTNLHREVKTIEMYNRKLTNAFPGDIIGLNISNVSLRDI